MRHIPEGLYSVKSGNFQAIDLPTVKEVRGKEYVYYGSDNLFPQQLIELYDGSAIHHTAIQAIKDGIIGDGIEIVGDDYINTKGETINEVFEKVALDYALYQGFTLNVIWNKEGNRIAELYHIPFANIRSGKMDENDEVLEYYYSSDWAKVRKHQPTTYRAFDVTDNKKENASQIFYCYNYTPGNDFYPLPSYVGALNDISLDMRVSRFHCANISSGIAPSMFIKFRNGVPTPEERRDIYNEIEQTFSGEDNAGRFFLSFSEPGKEMEVTPIENSNDDYYVVLEERITSRILTSHRITSPGLLGIKEATGFSSDAEALKVAYGHFEGTVIEPKRKKIMSSYGYLLKLMGWNLTFTIKPSAIVVSNDTIQETNNTPQ